MYSVKKANHFINENKHKVVDKYRQKFHFMGQVGWINDPNGFIFFKGEYHLFYQFHPYSSEWGPMHWGHAKSKDLIHWEHLPVALAPDQPYDKDGCFSGTAIVKDEKLYLIYTGLILGETESESRQVQCIAVSVDGIHFDKIQQNPVIDEQKLPKESKPEDFRDPKVFERNGVYYQLVASKTKDDRGQLLLYKSTDLIEWDFSSVFLEGTKEEGLMWECPDFFEIDGKEALIISPIAYPKDGHRYHNTHTSLLLTGHVDWEKGVFHKETLKEIDHSLDFYAPQTLIDDQGKRILIAWMQMWGRNMPTNTEEHHWAGSMVLPRELSLKAGVLHQTPAEGIKKYYKNEKSLMNEVFEDESKEFDGVRGEVFVLELDVKLDNNAIFEIELRSNDKEFTTLVYHEEDGKLILNRKNSGYDIIGAEETQLYKREVYCSGDLSLLKLEIYVDQSSVEVFVNDGIETMTANIYPIKKAENIKFKASGKAEIVNLSQWDISL